MKAHSLDIALATCSQYPRLEHPDEQPLLAALRSLGLTAEPWIWNGENLDWALPRLTVVRSAWDSHLHPEAFLAWTERAAQLSALHNPAEVLRWNLNKTYLRGLEARGIDITPTLWLEPGQRTDLGHLLRERAWDACVIKPCVSAGAAETYVFQATGLEEGQAVLERLLGTRSVMLQPYLRAFETEGERSYIFIDGVFSHAVHRPPTLQSTPRAFSEPHAFSPGTSEERRRAEDVMDAVGRTLLYARVDMATDNEGQPRLQEVELVEPSLFLSRTGDAAATLARAIAGRLG